MTEELSGFLGLPEEYQIYEKALVVVLPVPLDKTTSYMQGTNRGPEAIIEASHQVEFFDVELQEEVFMPGIHTLAPLSLNDVEGEALIGRIEKSVTKILDDQKFPIILGGEHTLTAGCVAAAAKKYPDLSILQIDAHADLRAEYGDTPYSHACAMRLSHKYAKKIVGVGIRAVCAEEVTYAKEHAGIKLIYSHEIHKDPHWIAKVLEGLSEHVYLTIDIDGFDPSLVPATGTPVPGGLSWFQGLDLILAVFQKKKVVAADLVELLPMENAHASSFVAAQLAYKLVGYHHKFNK